MIDQDTAPIDTEILESQRSVAEEPNPDTCRHSETPHNGVEIKLGKHTWIIPFSRIDPALDEFREEVTLARWTKAQIDMMTARVVTLQLLSTVYSASPEVLAPLIFAADKAELAEAIAAATTGPIESQQRHTYADWINAGLIANGINPATVNQRLLPHIVKHLVGCNRMLSQERFITVAVVAQARLAAIEANR